LGAIDPIRTVPATDSALVTIVVFAGMQAALLATKIIDV